MDKKFYLIIREKPFEIIKHLYLNKESFGSELSKVSDCTYSHTIKILQMFEKIGLTEVSREGRISFINLTEKGVKFASNLVEAERVIADDTEK